MIRKGRHRLCGEWSHAASILLLSESWGGGAAPLSVSASGSSGGSNGWIASSLAMRRTGQRPASGRQLQPLQRFRASSPCALQRGVALVLSLPRRSLPARWRRTSRWTSLASTRLMSASALAISLSSRARSAARSITPFSGSAAPPHRAPASCTAPSGAPVGEGDLRQPGHPLDRRRSSAAHARLGLGPTRPTSTSAESTSTARMFISARTERIAVTRSITQPISDSAASDR